MSARSGSGHEVNDPFELERFVVAQDAGATYELARAELRMGHKTSHWMWFVFPQLAGLGSSAMSRRYAIFSIQEARAYLAHPVLGVRLRECARLVAAAGARDATAIFGSIDTRKLGSSMTLFHRADPGETAFTDVLKRFFDATEDQATLTLLGG